MGKQKFPKPTTQGVVGGGGCMAFTYCGFWVGT